MTEAGTRSRATQGHACATTRNVLGETSRLSVQPVYAMARLRLYAAALSGLLAEPAYASLCFGLLTRRYDGSTDGFRFAHHPVIPYMTRYSALNACGTLTENP